jgi:ribosomal protein S18 acetylase RimI-like enzyme
MIEIRDARKSDADLLGELSVAAFGKHFDGSKVHSAINQFAEEAESEMHSVFSRYRVAEQDGKVVAMCGTYRLRWVGPQVRYLGWFFVDPARHREGIGRTLLKDSVESSRRLGARWLMVETDGNAEAAQSLYSSFGFRTLAEVPDYWADGDTLILMGLRLDA